MVIKENYLSLVSRLPIQNNLKPSSMIPLNDLKYLFIKLMKISNYDLDYEDNYVLNYLINYLLLAKKGEKIFQQFIKSDKYTYDIKAIDAYINTVNALKESRYYKKENFNRDINQLIRSLKNILENSSKIVTRNELKKIYFFLERL